MTSPPRTLIFWALAAPACTPDKPTDTYPDTAVDTGPPGTDSALDTGSSDTGDDPLPDIVERWNGDYAGEFVASLGVDGEEGMSDTCIGIGLVAIRGAESVPLQGTAPCVWQGPMELMFPHWTEPAAHFEGSVTEEGLITIGINFGPVQDVLSGEFESDTAFVSTFEGSFEFSPDVQVLYIGTLTGEITPTEQ